MNEINATERALVGLAIIDASVIDRAELELSGYCWSDKACSMLWPVLCSLRDKSVPVGDIARLCSELRVRGVLEEIGGVAEIGRLVQRDAGAIHAEPYYVAKLVSERNSATLELLLGASIDAIRNRTSSVSEIVDNISRKIVPLASISSKARMIGELAQEAYDNTKKEQPTKGVMCGLRDVDAMIGGFYPGEVVILAARPSIGKSAMGAQWALHAAKNNEPSLFISMEMKSIDVAMRAIAYETGIPYKSIRQAKLDAVERTQIERALPDLHRLQMFIEDRRGLNVDRLSLLIRSYVAKYGVKIVVVDYLGLVMPLDRRKPRWESMGEVSNALKSLALSESIPIVVLCQLNRESEGEVPKLSNLRDTGAIEQDADIVLLLHRPERDEEYTELYAEKTRNGETGMLKLEYVGHRYRFNSVELGATWEP